jgi:hypothetical protein
MACTGVLGQGRGFPRRLLAALALVGAAGGSLGSAAAAAPPGCADYAFSVYFRRGSASLAPGAETAIVTAARHFRRCPIASVIVVGLSAPRGGDILLENRLRAVAHELRVRGFRRPTPSIAGAVIARRRPLVADQAMVSITVAR